MTQRTAHTSDRSQQLYWQGQLGLCDLICSSDTVPAGCTSSPSYTPHSLNFVLWTHCAYMLKNITVITLNTLNWKNTLTKWIQACLAIHSGCISSLNTYSKMWAERWAQGKSSTIHLHPRGLKRIPTLCEEGSCSKKAPKGNPDHEREKSCQTSLTMHAEEADS